MFRPSVSCSCDTLAAAWAECGDFQQAVANENTALVIILRKQKKPWIQQHPNGELGFAGTN
jgi:hypothetical protein